MKGAVTHACSFCFPPDVDDEYEDEDQWEEGAEDILEKGEECIYCIAQTIEWNRSKLFIPIWGKSTVAAAINRHSA